jgi:hypothetical protein
VAGYPRGAEQGKPWPLLGSFEEWDKIVRGAVWFATDKDCNTTRRRAAEQSPDRLNKLALLEAWKELPDGGPKGKGVTSEEAHRKAFGYKADDKTIPAAHPELGDVLIRFSRDGKVSPRTIGNTIRAMRGQNLENMAFESAGDYKRSLLWRVAQINPASTPSGESGESGESDPNSKRASFHTTTPPVNDPETNGETNWNGYPKDSPDSPDSPRVTGAERRVFEVRTSPNS